MNGILRKLSAWFRGLFEAAQVEVAIVGLPNAGKTSLLRAFTDFEVSEYVSNPTSTVTISTHFVLEEHATLRFRLLSADQHIWQEYERYLQGIDAVVFVVDIADADLVPQVKQELGLLLDKPSLAGIPLLVLGNKLDLPNSMPVERLIEALDLKSICGRYVYCYGTSVFSEVNLGAVTQLLASLGRRT